jgi:hypothetical protein
MGKRYKRIFMDNENNLTKLTQDRVKWKWLRRPEEEECWLADSTNRETRQYAVPSGVLLIMS